MAKIALRVYNHEIEGLIEGGQVDEAITHCQHILKSFPMHVETYRLLGKAYLEIRRYIDAADIFLRILQAVPDDFVAHVGMSIIRDNENNLDESIWHMERAFEVQPSNPAIQGELRRLYGRRDGVEPPKIRLSRDALANMYAQGELFNQAITEIRSVLAEDANRADLQVMLARAHFRAGQKVEAAEMAIQLLKKYPYCVDALRILLEVLPGTTRADDTQMYRQRLCQLDPYAAFVAGSIFQSDQVSDAAVSLERLEYSPTGVSAPASGDWASSLGVKLDRESEPEKQPEWLSAATSLESTSPSASEPQSPSAESNVPDWLREAGWQESTGESNEIPLDLPVESSAAEPIVPADIPDWLQSMAPPDVTEAAKEESAAIPAQAGELPDWLQSMAPPEATGEAKHEPTEIPTQADESPDWLQSMAQPEEPSATKEEPVEIPAQPGELPDWLQSMAPHEATGAAKEEPAEIPAKADESPVRLQSVAPPQETSGAKEEPTAIPAQAGELPDWLNEMKPEPPVEPVPGSESKDASEPAGPTGPVQRLSIEDDAMGWLESLAAKQGANPDELLTKPEDRPIDAPDSVAKLGKEAPAIPGSTAFPEDLAPTSMPVPGESNATLAPESPEIEPIERLASAPSVPEMHEAQPGEELPGVPPASDEDTLATWLHSLDSSEVDTGTSTTPATSTEATAPKEVPVEKTDLPDWLQGLERPATTAAAGASAAADELPEWLRRSAASAQAEDALALAKEESAPVPEPPTATAPDEWVPAEEPVKVIYQAEPTTEPVSKQPDQQGIPAQAQDKDLELLSAAQSAFKENRLNDAIQAYLKLIKKGRLMDEVIHDLREANYSFPVDIIVWQTLGDAYMRANRLQEALDAYTEAEKLLR